MSKFAKSEMKNISKYLLLLVIPVMAGCQKSNQPETIIEGTVESINSYGNIVPSFSPAEFAAAGADYGDLFEISVGTDGAFDALYVDSYAAAGSMSPCICNYNRDDSQLNVGLNNGNLVAYLNVVEGDKISLRLKEKNSDPVVAYMSTVYTYDRADYASDAEFANFRRAGSFANVYRGTSPVNFNKNKVRYSYCDALCRDAGIQTVIDIADSDEDILNLLASPEQESSYMSELFAEGAIIGLGSDTDYVSEAFRTKMASGLRFMLSHPGPYFIHCNEGKDRTGFYFILLEALTGADLQEIKQDYMQTYKNFFHYTEGSAEYESIWEKNGVRMICHMAHPELWPRILVTDWNSAMLDGLDLAAVAREYLLRCGLVPEEIQQLTGILQESPAL